MGGGDIGESWRVRAAGEELFVKRYAGPDGDAMVVAEARGLAWLRDAAAIRVPEVRDAGDGWLVLGWIESGTPTDTTEEALGRGLAALHRAGAPGFGFEEDNFLGRLPQVNDPAPTWAAFYRDRRLAPLLARVGLEGRGEALLARLDDLVGPDEPPSRLHGDLWGGNWMCDSGGEPVLIDPAVYGGHREVDLAMMRLFGGFGERVFAAYREAHPLAPGHEKRVDLYQLYPLLVHLALFGEGYRASVERTIAAYV